MSEAATQVAAGVLLAAPAALGAYRARVLTISGALAAALVGSVVFGVGGWRSALVLFAFFIPATVLSHVGKRRKRALVDIGKHGARDALQVFANGGIAALSLLFAPRFGAAAFVAFAGAFAAAAADTWGTEIGTLVRGTPRSIVTLKRIATGLSGGVTWQGTTAEIAGSAIVATAASSLHLAPFIPVFFAGVAAAFVDSLLGATVQTLRYCSVCERSCETNPHDCGNATKVLRGLAWFGNDAVNAAATLAGAVAAMAFSLR